jgi:hypothetical protein
MIDSARAQNELAHYRQYSDMAHRTNGRISDSLLRMAREMLCRAARLDPAAVAAASAAAMARVCQPQLDASVRPQ